MIAHDSRGRFASKGSVVDRFLAFVVPEPMSGCWLWDGAIGDNGYGQFWAGEWTPAGHPRQRLAHRVSYELYVGEIPDGFQIDHLCRIRRCVNPAHLEAVTPRENTMRSESWAAKLARVTHCPAGHAYDETNTLVVQHLQGRQRARSGSRQCRACNRERTRRRRASGRAA